MLMTCHWDLLPSVNLGGVVRWTFIKCLLYIRYHIRHQVEVENSGGNSRKECKEVMCAHCKKVGRGSQRRSVHLKFSLALYSEHWRYKGLQAGLYHIFPVFFQRGNNILMSGAAGLNPQVAVFITDRLPLRLESL